MEPGFGGVTWEPPAETGDTWEISSYNSKELDDYNKLHLKNRCLNTTDHGPFTTTFLKNLDSTTDRNIEEGLKVFLYENGSLRPGYDSFLFSPEEVGGLTAECAGLNEDYAATIGGMGQLFLNERSIGVPTEYAYYAQVIPDCKGQSEKTCMTTNSEACKKCDDVILKMQDLQWPRNAKAHALAHMQQVAHPSMALVLGALAHRGGHTELDAKYEAMRKAAGEGFGETLADDKKTYLLMSSHDLTTNVLRYIMQEAGLDGVKKITKFSDQKGTKVAFDDVTLSYDVMFLFELKGNILTVKNFLLTLEDSRQACGFANKGAAGGDLLRHSDIPDFWVGEVDVFLAKVGKVVHDGVGADVATVHDTVKAYATALVAKFPSSGR